jgi:hypothetical protein
MSPARAPGAWPALPYAEWRDTLQTLQLWTQVIGKIRLAGTPWVNHSWHVTLYVSARGLTTGLIPAPDALDLEFDFLDHRLRFRTVAGEARDVPLVPQTVSDFYAKVEAALEQLGCPVRIHPVPNEIPQAIPFEQDTVHRAYDAQAATRFWRALVDIERVFQAFRTRFVGKCSPIHFFWGSFDLAVTRFSGRPAPLHPGGVPGLPDAVTREAYSHEVSSAGFWPGGGAIGYPAFYSYAYPPPPGFAEAKVRPPEARYEKALGEFLLPYDAVRTATSPDEVLLEFLQSTYEAAATLGTWDRRTLECAPGQIGIPRPVG